MMIVVRSQILLAVVVFCLAGCSKTSSDDCKHTWQYQNLERAHKAADDRIMAAMTVGIEEMKRRMTAAGKPLADAVAEGIIPTDADIPKTPRTSNGELHPLVKKFAINGDGALRGEGPSMDVLLDNVKQATEFLEEAKRSGCPR